MPQLLAEVSCRPEVGSGGPNRLKPSPREAGRSLASAAKSRLILVKRGVGFPTPHLLGQPMSLTDESESLSIPKFSTKE
jgi:hypothetical protein